MSSRTFVRIHVVVDVGLVFHDAGIFVGEKTLNRDIEFLLVIGQFADIGRVSIPALVEPPVRSLRATIPAA